jgi:hypothetical protein
MPIPWLKFATYWTSFTIYGHTHTHFATHIRYVVII